MKRFFIFLVLIAGVSLRAQDCAYLNIKEKASIPSACNEISMTMIHDALGRPVLYVANKEAGLMIYDISNLDSIKTLKQVKFLGPGNLEVMNLVQSGNFVYAVLGNTFASGNKAGLAIVDVTDPSNPSLTDTYQLSGSVGGGGVVAVEGNYAYLGAMGSGLVVLDITDKDNIVEKSVFKPSIDFPVRNPNSDLYNARGMAVRNSIVYLCFDAGGVRIINCTDKSNPIETGRFANPALYQPINLPRAYNNLVLDDSLLYVAVDYCGMEVLDIRDTSDIRLMGWWNPKNCPGNNWFTSPVHANEIHFDSKLKLLFISTGKSDMVVLNVSNPASPDSCAAFGGNGNGIGTWGVGLYANQIYLSYICTLGIPFASNWSGVKILEFHHPLHISSVTDKKISVFPNPANNQIEIQTYRHFINPKIEIYSSDGRMVFAENGFSTEVLKIDINDLRSGMYTILIKDEISVFKSVFCIVR